MAKRLRAWKAEYLVLTRPLGRAIAETGNSKSARQATFDGRSRVSVSASDNLANGFVRCVLNQRGTAVGDKLVQVKHRLDPSVCMDCRSLSVAHTAMSCYGPSTRVSPAPRAGP